MKTFSLSGRVLFLSASPEVVRRQIDGENLTLAQAGELRDNVSTDEITPTTRMLVFDDRLGQVPYVGLKCGDRYPIQEGEVRSGGFTVVVAGKRYGKGSSREHSPLAEKAAGIGLVVAKSFERIYRQNCNNIGLFTSTDLSLVDRLLSGEAVAVEELCRDLDDLSSVVVKAGGLLGLARDEFESDTPVGVDLARPATLAEKILARQLTHYRRDVVPKQLPEKGESAVVLAHWRFSHEYFTGLCDHLLSKAFGQSPALYRKETILAFEDHLNLAHASKVHVSAKLLGGVAELSRAHRAFVDRNGVLEYGRLSPIDDRAVPTGRDGSEGICHALMAELHALPGQIVVGTDSHTPHAGALGCLAFGAGSTDVACSWVTGRVRLSMPAVVQVVVNGELKQDVNAKDLVLHLLADPFIKDGGAIGSVIEYCGPAISRLSVDDRCTLTNMVAEMGGLTGIIEPDETTVEFLKERRGIDFALEPWMKSDRDAGYTRRLVIQAEDVRPMVASPGDPSNGIALDALRERPSIDIAYGGSCTAGKRTDFDHYAEVCRWALKNGVRLPTEVAFFLQFGTQQVRRYCEQRGYLATFDEVGAKLLEPGCGACANCGPGASTRSDQVTVSAINRNFPGRSGPGQVWLASPSTVAASAFLGRLGSYSELRESRSLGDQALTR